MSQIKRILFCCESRLGDDNRVRLSMRMPRAGGAEPARVSVTRGGRGTCTRATRDRVVPLSFTVNSSTNCRVAQLYRALQTIVCCNQWNVLPCLQ